MACLVTLAVPAALTFSPELLASGVFRSGKPRLQADEKVLQQRDGRSASITVSQIPGGVRNLRTNGKSDGATDPQSQTVTPDDRTVLLLGALGLAHHPQARHAAVIGLGTVLTSSVLLQAGALESVETIEIEPQMLQAAQWFRPRNAALFDDPRSRIVIDDARAHFARSSKRYDLIVSEPSNPWVSGVSSLFSMEFYERAASRLAAGGMFVQWLQLYEASPQMVGSIIRAFASAFPEFRVYGTNTADVVLVGRSDGPVAELSPQALDVPGLRALLEPIGIDSVAMLAAHDVGRGNFISLMFGWYGAPPNSDYFPYVDNRAAQDRFMGANSVGLQEMLLAPVPMLEFGPGAPAYLGQIQRADAEMPKRLRDLASGWHGQRFLRGQGLNAAQRGWIGNYMTDYELTRGWLWNCQRLVRNDLWDSALLVAGEVNRALPSAQARALWREVLDGPCRASLSARQIEWLELFSAVGGRDAAPTRDAADRLLAQRRDLTPRQHEYALLAATAARIALGEREAARKLYDTERKAIDKSQLGLPWFRYLGLALSAQANAPANSKP